MSSKSRKCYFSIPGSLPPNAEKTLRKQSMNPVPPSMGRDGVNRFLNLLEKSPAGLSGWEFFTVICDPLQRMLRIYQQWAEKQTADPSWLRFFENAQNQRACYGGYQHYVGYYDEFDIEIIRSEKLEGTEPDSDDSLDQVIGIPSWAVHWMLQFNPYEALAYGYDKTPPSCRNVAEKSAIIVGSNDCLLSKSLGGKIDAYDVVIRVNVAPLDRFENMVGSRTNALLVNAVLMGSISISKPRPIAELCSNKDVEIWLVPEFIVKGEYLDRKGYMPMLESDILFRKVRERLDKRPTTGLIAVMIAIRSGFGSVAIAGFGPLGKENTYSHYYEENIQTGDVHDFVAENVLLREWIDEGVIRSLDLEEE